ncbi:MAG: thioredoxin domain-containing protein [Deltaproteobacteria bacterium]|nr:thioredoxin domain-containing protein [Deltaproteobacteria bacterium]MBI3391504.1 thioredoxin domain-containing protein [Deltaproteobacteria bacterium]
MDQILKEYPKDAQFVYKQYPLPMHPFAMDAAKASLAASRQGKFWEMHDQLFANNKALQADKLKEYAQKIGLDAAKFEADMKSPEIQQQVQDEIKLGNDVGVTGTPTIFVNGKRLMNRSPEGFRAMIDEIIKKPS